MEFIARANMTKLLEPVTRSDLNLQSLLLQTFIGFLSFSLTIWTIVGNIFVLYTISTNKVLKASGVSNYLIGNLAISDLLLGCAVLPFSAYFVTFKTWVFGVIICHVWLSIDVLCCTASIWSLVVISYDRYLATNQPIHYRTRKMCLKTALAYCTVPWIISIILSLGPIFLGWGKTTVPLDDANTTTMRPEVGESLGYVSMEESNVSMASALELDNGECVLFNTPTFVVGSSFFSFYLPLFIMIFLYSRVFFKIHEQSNKFRKRADSERSKKSRAGSNTSRHNDQLLPSHNKSNAPSEYKQGKQISTAEARITKTLAIVLICFIACWLPFFIIYIIRSLLNDPSLIPDLVMDSFIWLGYLNSCMNPMIYLIVNVNFRNSLKELFKKIPQPTSKTTYENQIKRVNSTPPQKPTKQPTVDQKQVCSDQPVNL